MNRLTQITGLFGLSLLLLVACDGGGPATADRVRSPQYSGAAEEYSSGERGNIQITEIGFAGSVDNNGNYDPDDVFLEIQNRHPRPINLTNWHLILEGDVVKTLIIKGTNGKDLEPLQPNEFFVIAAKRDGAFGLAADLIMPELEFGQQFIHLELRDPDLRLMEGAGHDGRRVFTGGWDTYSTRTMERVQLIFGNRGNASRNWHAYSENVTFFTNPTSMGDLTGTDPLDPNTCPTSDEVALSVDEPGVRCEYRLRTFASPGVANSRDYSGSAAAGNFE